jgi:radical SAM protein with 4Fe4S-binding SPASM domain
LTPEAIAALKTSGVDAISLSLDGATAASHDAIRQVEGCFARTLASAEAARAAELPFQVNTLVSAETIDEMPQIERLARSLGASRWSLFFLVTVGRGTVLQPITAERTEQLLEWLAERGREPGMIVTTTEAPHFRRIAMARRPEGMPKRPAPAGNGHMAGIRDGNGIMFIGDDGEVFPSGFLPISAGNVNTTDPIKIYRESELFLALRDVSKFGGRCGQCEFGSVCGGSRARAWAATGDWLAEDPLCPYEPRGYTPEAQPAKPMHLPVV